MSFFSRILGRTAPVADPESWQVGDWAECIIMGQWTSFPEGDIMPGPRHGQVTRVTGVEIRRDDRLPGGKVLTLTFAGWPASEFGAAGFRKLNPRADQATAAEAEFTQLVRRAPARQPQPALPRETIEEFQ